MVKNLLAPLFLLVALSAGYVWVKETRFTKELAQAEQAETGNSDTPTPRETTEYSAPATTAKSDPVPAKDISPRVAALNEILKTKDDNDPRLDTDFENLTSEEKKQLQEKYRGMKPEQLNERGTVIFLLGRNLKEPEDVQFLAEVLKEPTCQSLGDCKTPAPPSPSEGQDYEEIGTDLTLAYPQVVSLKVMESYLSSEEAKDPRLVDEIQRNVDLASQSKNLIVSRLAAELKEEMNP